MGEEAMTKSNPEKPASVGPRARAGQARLLTSHVPIRFRPQTIERAKAIAERDGMTVSSWIRMVVEREVERRMPVSPHTRLSESGTSWRVVHYDNPIPEAETKNPDYDSRHAQLEPA
jgi:antitoxin component of RelBE/YafQ-DinJ toxin-antitoxin module